MAENKDVPNTFVYDNVEVKKTNRTASKILGSGRQDVLFEITPIQQTTGSWKKWVRDGDLFLIEQSRVKEDKK